MKHKKPSTSHSTHPKKEDPGKRRRQNKQAKCGGNPNWRNASGKAIPEGRIKKGQRNVG